MKDFVLKYGWPARKSTSKIYLPLLALLFAFGDLFLAGLAVSGFVLSADFSSRNCLPFLGKTHSGKLGRLTKTFDTWKKMRSVPDLHFQGSGSTGPQKQTDGEGLNL